MRPKSVLILTPVALAVLSSVGCQSPEKAAPAAPEPSAPQEKSAPTSSKNNPPRVTDVKVSPAKPKTLDDLRVEAAGLDPDGKAITLHYQWYLNGAKQLGAIGETFSSSQTARGDKLEVEVTAHDGQEFSAPVRSAAVTILNSAPELRSQLAAGLSLDGFRMEVSDIDNDPITYRLEGAPPNMSVDASGTLHWKPSPSDKAGEYEVVLTAEDGQGGNVTLKFPVQIKPPVPPH